MGRKSNYENGMYQQLMEIMGRLENVEKDSAQKIDTLNKRIDTLENENLPILLMAEKRQNERQEARRDIKVLRLRKLK